MSRTALITGITGQDGSYLAELLLAKEYKVHGLVRESVFEDPDRRLHRIRHLLDKVTLHTASLESYLSVHSVVEQVQPTECYHLAAKSFVAFSFDEEFSTLNTNINGTHGLLSALKSLAPDCRFCFAGSSEMFGAANESPQRESTRFRPRSCYGISKVTGSELTRYYREAYKLHAGSAILFNHESPRRGIEFVTRKITSTTARIAAGKENKLKLGSLSPLRDWGYAPEYVEAMWLMLQQDEPDDYVISTGESHSVEEFVSLAFSIAGLDWREHVEIDPAFYRPGEAYVLRGDSAKAHERLSWKNCVSFREIVKEMMISDLALNNIEVARVAVG